MFGGYDTDWGLPLEKRERHWIIIPYCTPSLVLAKTIGQYTGITNARGEKIFEGDIISFEDEDNLEVKWSPNSGAWKIAGGKYRGLFATRIMDLCKVIGNIHDNPELLEESVK